ncbi:MAG: hypothetical protein QF685_03875, partial [Verrucomicrobiota bacterium]|nr:hypothetical protein [Verrucomicrobiota bacterium]
GTALNTATTIEITQEDGTSFPNPVFIQLPNAGVAVEDNGTRIQVASDSIPWSDADNNSSSKRAFKIYNAVGNSDLLAAQTFAVNKQPAVDGLGGFAVAAHFNRDKTEGDDLSIFGSGFLAVKNIIITDDTLATDRVTIPLPSPGITVTDTSILIDTSTYQLGDGADTLLNGVQRIVKLESARDNATSSVAQRFRIGAPPTLTQSPSGITGGNYTRTIDTMALVGTGFGHMTLLEIVDVNGNPIAGVPGIFSGADGTGGTGLNIADANNVSVDPNATGWLTTAYLLDSASNGTRRVRITTPFGSVTSLGNNTDSFRVGAQPELLTTVQTTFAGGGFNGGTTTYDKSDGDLMINGSNFRGIDTVAFGAAGVLNIAGGNFTVDPTNPPAGFTFNADGTKITIDSDAIPAGWIGIATATIFLGGVDDLNSTSGQITTQE